MVFFTCNACGESLKKAQVEKHVNMCRGCEILSCIDCGKDFWGNDYKNHIKCISEDQKYGGKGYEAKSNKGDVKQQQWIQRIQEAMNKPGIGAKLKDVLNQVSSYDNVPRKKSKFQNWMKNSLKIHNPTLHDQVWDIFSAATSSLAPEAPNQTEEPRQSVAESKTETNGSHQNGTSEEPPPEKKKLNKRERKEARQKKSGKKEKKAPENGSTEEEEASAGKRKDKKRKRSSEEDGEQKGHNAGGEVTTKKRKTSKKDSSEDDQNTEAAEEEAEGAAGEASSKGKFNWKGTIKAVLKQSPEEGLAVKKLRKKVLSAYYSFSGEGNFKSEEELLALFNKKIKGNPKFRELKDKVRLVK
ncbi:cell growth-regulating nucleolar protein [Oncorhynchus tshawytscha]|uniref:Cell growth-regulating nucleolar protein n=2 Tax=Oncorhynchus tshawytscha TaxID=74940 RepID=A0A8C8K854_ONCTS|nr:cell growth-regulating nucleolar protein [Oncorhynchus tshawytscha]